MMGVLPFESLEPIRPYLLTTHMSAFEQVLADEFTWAEVGEAALWVGAYIVAALVGAVTILGRRGIKC